MFGLFCDENGFEFVKKVKDELTKNHRDTEKDVQSGIMPENHDWPMCPVRSFKMYFEHLNPTNKHLWQNPLQKVNEIQEKVWFGKGHLGKNPLGTFMSCISKETNLSKVYTNHSIRVTGASIFQRCNYHPKQIMSVTGHKSVQSLTIYTKVQDKEKVNMGKTLTQALQMPDDKLSLMSPPVQGTTRKVLTPSTKNFSIQQEATAEEPQPSTSKENMQVVHVDPDLVDEEAWGDTGDIDLMKMVADLEEEHAQKQQQNQAVEKAEAPNQVNVMNNMNEATKSLFNNCKIANIIHHFHDK